MRIKSLVFVIGLCSCNWAQATYFAEMDVFAFSGPVPIHTAINDWRGEFTGGENAVTHNHVEVGVASGPWKLGLVSRYDYEIDISNATADFVFRVKNKIPLQTGKVYPLRLKVRHSSSRGLHGRYLFMDDHNWKLSAGVSLLNGLQLTEGEVSGSAVANSDRDYNFNFDVDYAYSRDSLFKRDVSEPAGYGFSTDLSITYSPYTNARFLLEINDLLGMIFWLDGPRTVAHASSATKTFDENGYVVYLPLVSGRESSELIRQVLPPTMTFISIIDIDKLQLISTLYKTRVNGLYQWGFGYRGSIANVRLHYQPQTYARTLEIYSRRWHVSLTADSSNRRKANIFALSVRFSY